MGMTGHAPQFEAERGPSLRSLYAAKMWPRQARVDYDWT